METLSVVALVVAAAVCFVRVVRLRPLKSRWFLFCTGLLGSLFVFGAGEEVSWGQRIFNVESPAFFQEHNAQRETNLHNLVVGDVKINKLVFGQILAVIIVSYVLILPFLYRKKVAVQRWVDGWAIPLPRALHIVSYLVVFGITAFIPSSRKGEMVELAGCAMFLLIVLYPLNRSIFSATRR